MSYAGDEGREYENTGGQNEEQQVSGRVHKIPAVPLRHVLHNAEGLAAVMPCKFPKP